MACLVQEKVKEEVEQFCNSLPEPVGKAVSFIVVQSRVNWWLHP